TRITQALGRCTRDENDYALVMMWGQDLLAWCSKKENRRSLLPELQAEIELGLDTSNDCEDGGLVELANQFFAQGDEWQQANEQILAHRDELSKTADASAELLGKLVSKEVQYSQLMWSNQHERAFEVAAALADSLSSDAFKPYRGFWYHEAATAAFLAWRTSGKEPYRTECLKKLD